MACNGTCSLWLLKSTGKPSTTSASAPFLVFCNAALRFALCLKFSSFLRSLNCLHFKFSLSFKWG